MESAGGISLEMVIPKDVLIIDGQERFAGAIFFNTTDKYRWVDVMLDGGKGDETLEFSLADGVDRPFVVYYSAKLTPADIGLRRGQHLPGALNWKGEEYLLGSDGQVTIQRVDRRESRFRAHFADYVCDTKHIGVEIFDVTVPVFAGDAEVWYGEEIDFNRIQILPIDTDHPRKGLLTNSTYKPMLTDQHRHWWNR